MSKNNSIRNKSVYVVGGSYGYVYPFLAHLKLDLVHSPDEADILWFTGGEDVDPALYGEKVGHRTHYSAQRSYEEDQILQLYPEKFKVGICRGLQQFNVFDGGKLVQHCNNHAGRTHWAMGALEPFLVNSAHHQMIIPSDNCIPLLWTSNRDGDLVTQADIKQDGEGKSINLEVEPEAAYWPNLKAFGVQYHPEWLHEKEPAFKWFIEKVKLYCELEV